MLCHGNRLVGLDMDKEETNLPGSFVEGETQRIVKHLERPDCTFVARFNLVRGTENLKSTLEGWQRQEQTDPVYPVP